MSSAINFGNSKIDTKGMGGVVSNLNWKSLLETTYTAETKAAEKKKTEIEFSDKKIAAYSEFKNLISSFHEANNKVRNIFTPSLSGSNHLRQKVVAMSTSNGEEANNYITVTPGSQFTPDSFQIKVNSIAKNEIHESIEFASTSASITQEDHSSEELLTVGSFTITGEDGSQEISVETGDSLDNIVAKINAAFPATGVKAQIVKPSESTFKVQIESKNTGADFGFSISDPDGVLNSVLAPLQEPTDASITYNSSTVTRSSNKIDDYIDHLTINLKSTTPTGEYITVTVDYDTEKAKAAITDWVETYNEIVKFVHKQQQRTGDEGGFKDTAILRTDHMMNLIYREITQAVGSKPIGDNIEYNNMDEFGLTTGVKVGPNFATDEPGYSNLISINEDLLSTSLQGSLEKVQQWFEFKYDVDTTKVRIISRSNNFPADINSFSLAVDITEDEDNRAVFIIDGEPVYGDFTPNDSEDLTKGGIIRGQQGTVLEGFTFIYSGTGTTTANFTISRGIGDRLYNIGSEYFEKNYPDPSSSSNDLTKDRFEAAIISETVSTTQKYENIKKIEDMALRKIDEMGKRFAAMEAEIASYNNSVSLIDAIFNSKSKD